MQKLLSRKFNMPERRNQRFKRAEQHSFQNELTLFGRTTSMRGVPRILKADSLTLKLVWALAILALFTLAAFQVFKIASTHFKYDVYTTVYEKSFHPTNDKPVYPSLTICNQNPFSNLRNHSGILTLQEYYSNVSKLTSCSHNPGNGYETTSEYKYFCKNLLSQESYFQYIGTSNAREIGHKLEDFIVDCNILLLTGLIYDKIPCTNLVNISLIQNVKYFNCYNLEISNNYFISGGLIAGVSLVLHLDNGLTPSDKFNNEVKEVGAVITPHHPDMPAFPSLDGILVPSGASSRIHAEIKQRVRASGPYGSCQEGDYQGYEKLKLCVAQCLSQTIETHCDCIHVKVASKLPNPDANFTKPYCFNIADLSLPELLQRAACVNNVTNITVLESCLEGCPQPCREYQYVHYSSFCSWPGIWDLESFYTSFISGRNYESHYSQLKDVVCTSCSNTMDCYSKKMIAYKAIQNNFLQISYRLSDHRYLRLEDIPKSLIEDVCSQVGGVLNLWSGITIIVFLELLEMFCRILKNWGEVIHDNNSRRRRSLRNIRSGNNNSGNGAFRSSVSL